MGREIIDVEGNKSWEKPNIHTVPLAMYMCKGSEGGQSIKQNIQPENEGVTIPAQVKWMSNPRAIKGREQT